MTKVAQLREPESYVKAMKDTYWHVRMEEEMRELDANDTWDLVDPRRHYKPIGCKWVYKIKYNVDGSDNWYKARLVAKGYAWTHGINYDESFELVTKMTMVRVVLAVGVPRGWHLHQMDVKNKFFKEILKNKYAWSSHLDFNRR